MEFHVLLEQTGKLISTLQHFVPISVYYEQMTPTVVHTRPWAAAGSYTYMLHASLEYYMVYYAGY